MLSVIMAILLAFATSASQVIACSLPGDGQGNGPPLSYTDNGNGTVTDNVTGLIWEKTTPADVANQYSFSEVSAFFLPSIDGLGGHHGWRLPNVKELQSVVNYGVRWPSINQSIFGPIVPVTQTTIENYWSISPAIGGGEWSVDFNIGGEINVNNKDTYVRAVWGSPANCFPGDGAGHGKPLSYTGNGDTVTDNVTGLMWEKTTGVVGTETSDPPATDVNNTYTWTDANTAFVAKLDEEGLGGYSDWRLPNIKELESIADYGVTHPAIDQTVFGPNVKSFYWSSTPHTGANTCAWGVGFGAGRIYHNDRSTYHYVRAVRGG